MKCVEKGIEKLDLPALDELDWIEVFPVVHEPTYYAFPESFTTSETTCAVSVTVAEAGTYNGVFCYAQSPLGLDAWRGFGQGLTQNVTWSASIGAWAGAGPVISGIQANTVADAVNTALGDLGLSGRVFPYNPAFAGVFDPSFTASWPQSISFHSTRTFSRESPRVPGSRYAVKYYEEPCGEKKAALTPPTGTAYHDWQAFRYYFLGENVNLEHAVDFLVNRNYPLWQYNVVLPVK